jgi:NADH:ubiquinone oxidoreductase subunit 2 (subunit N)
MNTWLSIWVILEINTLSFCVIIKSQGKEKKNILEIRIKYFIIQSISSAFLLLSSISTKITKSLLIALFTLRIRALIIKSAAAPFHQWFISIVKSIKWKRATILMTWQKLAPTFLVLYQIKNIIYTFIATSLFVGAISQINKNKTLQIIAFSSVFNLSWILLAILINTKLFLRFSVIYWTTVVITIIILNLLKIEVILKENIESTDKWTYLIIILNLGGIPPIIGFLAKWLVFSEALANKYTITIRMILIIRRLNLYIYIRMLNFIVIRQTQNKQKRPKKNSKKLSIFITTLNRIPLIITVI